MTYQYKNMCYSLPSQVYTAMAADVPSVSSDGGSLEGAVLADGYSIRKTTGIGSNTIVVHPTLINCIPDVDQATELSGLVTLVIITAWGMAMLKRPIR